MRINGELHHIGFGRTDGTRVILLQYRDQCVLGLLRPDEQELPFPSLVVEQIAVSVPPRRETIDRLAKFFSELVEVLHQGIKKERDGGDSPLAIDDRGSGSHGVFAP